MNNYRKVISDEISKFDEFLLSSDDDKELVCAMINNSIDINSLNIESICYLNMILDNAGYRWGINIKEQEKKLLEKITPIIEKLSEVEKKYYYDKVYLIKFDNKKQVSVGGITYL